MQDRLEVPDVAIGRATRISEMFRDVPFDGVLGLAFQSIATNTAIMPPFVHAHEFNLVDPIFTVHLRRVG
ncbi:hypothetical protein ANCDUO_21168, partial [Ancylostoma duodenale]